MTRAYGVRPFPFLLLSILIPGIATSQSLEDRVSQIRRDQSSNILEMDQQTLDSLLKERATQGGGRAPGGTKSQAMRPRLPSWDIPSDSLIMGPDESGWDSYGAMDTLDTTHIVRDSLGRPIRGHAAQAARRLPRRYEQRIFRNASPSTFSSAKGGPGRDYVLGPGDEVSVFIWGDKEKEYPLVLNPEGKIFLEGVGLVPLGGLSLDEAAKRVKERLARIYSGIGRGTTQVDIVLGRPGPVKVFMLGEVKVPGGYVFTGNTSILSALYFARGPSDIGSVRNLQLTRGGRKYALDIYQYLMKGENLTPGALQDGDILFAPRAEILVDVRGDVGRPATFELKRGEGVKEALEYAGGANATAAQQSMTLQRTLPGGRIEFKDLDSPRDYLQGKSRLELADGDRLMVFKSTEAAGNFVTVTGPVKYPGTYSAEGARSVEDVIRKAGGLREDAFLGRVHVVRFRPDGSSMLLAHSLDTVSTNGIEIVAKDNVILYSIRDMYLPDSVEVSGAVFRPGRYEFREGMTAKDLVMQAGGFLPNHEEGRLVVFRGDALEAQVEEIKVSVEKGLAKSGDTFRLHPRDFLQVPEDPRWYRKEIVTLTGLFNHPGKYALLHPGERLSSVVKRAGGFKPNAYSEGGRFFRSKDSVGRMGVDIVRAMAKPRSKANISLVGGDSIHIPERLNTVKVIGEVGFETSVLFKEGETVQYYIEKAGGFTRRSEKDRIVVQYANGETSRDGYFNRKPDAGSVIFVPQGPEPKPLDFVASINALLGTLGVAAALILSIQAISN